MAIVTYRPPEGTCWCSITVGGGETNRVAVSEISSLGSVVGLKGELRRHEYADVILEVAGHDPLTLFAHVVNVRSKLVHLRWLHFEPGEEAALAMRLAKLFTAVDGVEAAQTSGEDFAWRQEQGTRRVVRPRSSTTEGGNNAEPESAAETERKTRRVVRPRKASADGATDSAELQPQTQPAAPPAAAANPRQGGQGTTTGSRKVVAPRKRTETSDGDEYAAPDAAAAQPGSALAAANEPRAKPAVQPAVQPRPEPQAQVAEQAAPQPPAAEPETGPEAKPSDAPASPAPAPAPAPAAAAAKQGDEAARPPSTRWRERAVAISADDAEHVALVNTDRHLRSAPSPDADQTRSFKDDASRKILSRARTVQASELAARHDKVRVLNMSTIKELIKDAVAESLVDLNTGMSTDRLAEEVERRVDQQLQAFKAEKQDFQAQAKRLEEELSNAREAIERERKRAIEANSFTVSETGLLDLERRLERLVASAIRRNGVNDALAEELRGMVTLILDDERDKIAENAKKAQADTIELLERKISRLSGSLTESQKERERQQRALAAMEQSGGMGLRNVMTAGLDGDDPELERKKALMKEIIEQNRQMREVYVKRHGELPGHERKAAAEQKAQAEAAATATAAPAPAAEAEAAPPVGPEEAPHLAEALPTDLQDEGEYTGPPEVDPDDLPWDGSPITSIEDDYDSPVKKIAASATDAAAKAPPLAIVRRGTGGDSDADSQADSDAAAGDIHDRLATEVESPDQVADETVNASPEIDPDDLPWEAPAEMAASDQTSSGIKRISPTVHREPPPLERS